MSPSMFSSQTEWNADSKSRRAAGIDKQLESFFVAHFTEVAHSQQRFIPAKALKRVILRCDSVSLEHGHFATAYCVIIGQRANIQIRW